MPKRKKITWIVSLFTMLVLICSSLCAPFFHKTEGKVKAEGVNNFVYAFVSKQSDKITNGKIYVDFGLSIDYALDTSGAGTVNAQDAEKMLELKEVPFETAKIYLRTRNISAVAEQGDYEAINEVFTVDKNAPYFTLAVKVNAGGLRVGDVSRQFCVEIYKVEVTGLDETAYTLKQPNTTETISTETLSTNAEITIGKKTQSSLDRMDLGIYQYSMQSQDTCRDVTENTSFNDIRVDLANAPNGWYNKVKYMSEHGMAKLGIRTSMAAFEDQNGVYTDNSFVGVQIFAGDARSVGAPALEGVPDKNVFNNGSAVELARWFAKFQSDEREGLELNESFNGSFEGVSVSSLFNENVYIARGLLNRDHGQGGTYDHNVNSAAANVFVIDDLDAVMKGSTTISTRVWSYLSGKKKYYSGSLMYIPTNYRAQVLNATLAPLRTVVDEKTGAQREKVGLSIRFNEPLQFKKDVKDVAPYVKGCINSNNGNELTFHYVSGNGTDTFYFEAFLETPGANPTPYKMKVSSITLKDAYGFENVYDFAPNCPTAGYYGDNQNISIVYEEFVNGWDNVYGIPLHCAYDLRTPEISVNGNVSSAVKTSHTTTIRTANVSETGRLYYGWTAGDQKIVPENLSSEPILAQGFQMISSPANISGTRYLYAYALSELDKKSQPLWIGPFHFDNEKPILDIDCEETYQEQKFDITITNNTIDGFLKFAALKEKVTAIVSSNANGGADSKEFDIKIPSEQLNQATVTLDTFTLKAEDVLELPDGEKLEYGTYYVSFAVSDVLENRVVTEPIPYYFDVREIFNVSLAKQEGDPDFEMSEFAAGAGKLTLDKNYYTIDLSKKDLAEQNSQDFYFTLEASDKAVSAMSIEEFSNVTKPQVSVLSKLGVPEELNKTDNRITITIKEKFEPGLYRLILKDETSGSKKKSLPVYFYVTNGRASGGGRYQEETGGYQSLSSNSVFTNQVFQIPTSVPFYYMTDTGEVKTESYSGTNQPATFSSWGNASAYVLYREYLDLYAISLTQSFANDLNSGIYRKADGVTQYAEKGQIWIRYKEVNWRPNSTTSAWVYYYYGESSSSLKINVNAISHELQVALHTVSGMICNYGQEVDLVTEEYLDKNGAPKIADGQMHLKAESASKSMSGTEFQSPAEYFGDYGMYLSLDADAPLSTNALVPYAENRWLYYKTEGSEYHPLTKGSGVTFGEYLNATDKFTILELDENGAREYCIYVDKTEPTVTLSWKTQNDTLSKEFSKEDNGQTISGNNFYIESLEDYDTLSFVAIYRYTGQGEGDLLNVYRKSDFDSGHGIRLEDGKYHVYVSDRSGNSYSFVLQMKSEALVCTVREVENSYIRVSINRSAEEVRYQVYLDGWLLTTDYNETRFSESGEYRFLIEDIYGNVYDEVYTFERTLPIVTWRYQAADGSFVPYEENCEKLKIQKTDDLNYSIKTSTYLRFLPMDGCTYQIISGTPHPNQNLVTGWVTLNNMTTFTMKVYYETHPDTYVIYTCMVDNTAPQVNVSYQKSFYQNFEIEEINEKFTGNEFEVGKDNIMIPTAIGFGALDGEAATLYVSEGERVQSKYFKVLVSDESEVKDVKIYLDGVLILAKESDFGNIYISRRGFYEIVATDDFGNQTTFSFTNEFNESVEYFVDGQEFSTNVSFETYFNEKTYTKVEYGNAQAEIKLLSSVEVHYLITDDEGQSYYFAFVAEDGALYTFQYLVRVVETEGIAEIESISSRGTTALASGLVAEIKELGVGIYLHKYNDGTLSLTVRSTDTKQKTYTVETRVSTTQANEPYYFKTKISTIPSSIEFMNEEGKLIPKAETMKINGAFSIRNRIDEDIQRIEVAYSEVGDYKTYTTVYDGVYQNVVFSDEGMYHVRVINRYGVQTQYYVILSKGFTMTAMVEYMDGTSLQYSMEYVSKHEEFYSNKSVEFIVYAANVKVLNKHEAVSVTLMPQGYTLIYVDKPGEYLVEIEDEFGNVLEKRIYIDAKVLTIGEDVLTNFNENALRRDENYTNQPILLKKDVVLKGGEIFFISMRYGSKTITIYDELQEVKTSFDEDQWIGLFGDGEYMLAFRDRYGNKAETVIHYRGVPTLTILRTTLNGIGAETYPLEGIQENGVWTNDTVRFSVSASEYLLTVDGMQNVSSIDYATKTKNEYEVYYLDEYGFQYSFKVHLFREDVVIASAPSMAVTLVSDVLVTKDNVQIEFTPNATCTYVLNEETEKVYKPGDVLYKDGIYHFRVVDKAGNVSTYTVKKDSAVEYRLEGTGVGEIMVNGGVTNGLSVQFYPENSDNAYVKKVFHNNALIEYDGETFTERGKWELILADDAGNETYFRFYILYGKLDGFSYNTPHDYMITSVIWEMKDSISDAMETVKKGGSCLEATENGTYTVTMQSAITGDIQTFSFTIDNTPPQVELVGCTLNEKTINNVTVKGCSVGDTVYVYKNGELIKTVRIDSEYTDAPTISESGKYRIVVESEAGVKTELFFERKYVPNAAGSILIIVLALAAVAGLLVGLVWRNHSKTDD